MTSEREKERKKWGGRERKEEREKEREHLALRMNRQMTNFPTDSLPTAQNAALRIEHNVTTSDA